MNIPDSYTFLKKLNTAINKIIRNIENGVSLSVTQSELLKELYKLHDLITLKNDKRTKVARQKRHRPGSKSANSGQKGNNLSKRTINNKKSY